MAFHAIKFRPEPRATMAALAMFLVLVGLGCWQMQRLAWKTELLARIDAQMAAAAVPLPGKISYPVAWEWRRVTFSGHFLKEHAFLLKPRTQDGKAGYHLVMPFRYGTGATVFVNRGWVDDETIKHMKPVTRVEGIAESPARSSFTPENDPARNDWYWADIPAMAKASGLRDVTPVLVRMGAVRPAIPNDHLQYAVFWFGMAFILLIVYVVYHARKGRKP